MDLRGGQGEGYKIYLEHNPTFFRLYIGIILRSNGHKMVDQMVHFPGSSEA